MNQRKLFLQLLPGFIPLFVFIIADEIWGTTVGLIVAVASGIIELAWYWFKDRKFDKFILLDTLLIIILGVVSIVLDNDVVKITCVTQRGGIQDEDAGTGIGTGFGVAGAKA